MSIAVQGSRTSRVQALAARQPNLAPEQIARQLGLLTSEVKAALGRDRRRRVESAAR
jgi:hypothetical protein